MRRVVTDLSRRLAAENKRVNGIFQPRDDDPEVQQKLDKYRSDLIARIDAVLSALIGLRPVYEAQIQPKKTWKDAAWDLVVVFETAMKSVVPDRSFGHSQGGPVVRFVHATLPRVVDKEVTEAAIALEFKRTHRNGTKPAA
jgi:hypothetical protein